VDIRPVTTTQRKTASERKVRARAALHTIPIPKAATLLPRPGGLKSAALWVIFSLREADKAVTTREVGRRIKALSWAPVGWSDRRLATILCEMAEKDRLIGVGKPTLRGRNEGGPTRRKTWVWKGARKTKGAAGASAPNA